MMKIADLRNTILDMYRLLNLGGMIFLVIAFTHGYRHDIAWQEKHSTIMPDIGHDNSILHHFLNLGKIAREFADFIIHVIKLDEHMHADNPLSNHWLVWAEKPLEVSP
ncbi:MAG: hypothetical protein JW704_13540 [Anaerolineaceae bacterium]|nr:hypothetical protein [Anaerolineaceae bacterium]MBN2676493.1 hypothetical protein [Anaerolineaceae bacterium]